MKQDQKAIRSKPDLDFSFLSRTPLFLGASPEEIEAMTACLEAETRTYEKGQMIYRAGDTAAALGLVLRGRVLIVHDDFWGNATVLDSAGAGQIFAETYACTPGEPMMVKRGGGGGFPGAFPERGPDPSDLLPILRAPQPPYPKSPGSLGPQEPESVPENLLHGLQICPGPSPGLSF